MLNFQEKEYFRIFENTRRYLTRIGLPPGDAWELPTSRSRFPGGEHFRVEVPTVNNFEAFKALLEEAHDNDIVINRVSQTAGLIRYTARELEQWIEVARDNRVELYAMAGVRALYDTGAQVHFPAAQARAPVYRLRGMEQVIRAIEDMKRGLELGLRGLIVNDEGLLFILDRMRKDGEIPGDTKFKASATLGYCNAVSIKILEDMGADSINPIRDLQLPMIASIRQAVKTPLDVHVDNPESSGGFIRTYEAPEIVRLASPVYIKTGNIIVPRHGMPPAEMSAGDGKMMARQATVVVQTIKKYYPDMIQTTDSKYLAVPK